MDSAMDWLPRKLALVEPGGTVDIKQDVAQCSSSQKSLVAIICKRTLKPHGLRLVLRPLNGSKILLFSKIFSLSLECTRSFLLLINVA